MATPVIAAGAGALGFYLWLRQWQQCGYAGVRDLPLPLETHACTEAPPNTWLETIYLFKEAVRYMYTETFGRWHALDLFFGLAYLSRRAMDEYPAADIAAAGHPLSTPGMSPAAAQELLMELQHARRYMLYCQGLRHHKPEQQRKHWKDMLGLGAQDIICHNPTAGLLRPAYVIVRDTSMGEIILCVRGTHSRPDMFTSLTGVVKPHHAMTPDGVVLGYSHLGMLAAARWLMARTKDTLITALQQHPGYQLRAVGHSMGGGTAAMLTMMFRERVPELSAAMAYAVACPACMTLQLAASCAPFVTTLIHGTDIVPTFSTGAIDALRQEVTESSWFAEFQADVQQRLTANFSSSLRGLRQGAVGTAAWTQRNIISTAAAPLTACYSRVPQSCYSRAGRKASGNGDSSTAAAAAADGTIRRGPFSGLAARLSGSRPGDAAGTAAAAPDIVDANDYVVGASGAQILSTEQSSLLMRSSAAGWLRGWGSRGKRHSAAAPAAVAAADLEGAREGGRQPGSSEADLVERALEACLSAADSGQFGPVPGSTAAAAAGAGAAGQAGSSSSISRVYRTGTLPGAAVLASSAGASRGSVPGSYVFRAASRAVLGKRPAAPGKKDDDDATNFTTDAADAAGIGTPALGSIHSSSLPISTAAADAGATSNGSGAAYGGTDSAAVAASSTGKPVPVSLRRRGWAWGGMLGSKGDGWVTDEQQQDRSSSDAGGLSVVRYLGETVGNTGRLVLESTGQLLKGTVMFQACTVPAQVSNAAAGAHLNHQQQQHRRHRQRTVVQPAVPPQQQQQQQQQQQDSDGTSQSAAGGIMTIAPGSSTDLMRMERGGGPFPVALAAAAGSSHNGSDAGAADDDLDGGSDCDPDLQDEQVEDQDHTFALDQPAIRASISALMAAVSVGEGDLVARAHKEEAVEAERLLRESGSASVGPARMGQQQQQQQSGAVGDRASAELGARSGSSSSIGELAAAVQEGLHADHGAADRAAERLARRQMYPAGRILHFLPATVVAAAQASKTSGSSDPDAAALGSSDDDSSSWPPLRELPRLTAASGTAGLGDNYVLLEMPTADVYGRMRLCPSMVRDHFIPSYLKAVDNVIGQLMLLDRAT